MNVELVRWPAEADRRSRLQDEGRPRILVVEGRAAAPICRHQLEDWVRPPISRDDLQARRAALLARAQAQAVPTVDEDNVLIFGVYRLCLSPAEAALMSVLCAFYGCVVERPTLTQSMWLDGGSHTSRRNALDLRVLRLRRRLQPLHLTIRTVWGRGYMLTADAASASAPGVPEARAAG